MSWIGPRSCFGKIKKARIKNSCFIYPLCRGHLMCLDILDTVSDIHKIQDQHRDDVLDFLSRFASSWLYLEEFFIFAFLNYINYYIKINRYFFVVCVMSNKKRARTNNPRSWLDSSPGFEPELTFYTFY